jgi:hypothetical protein
MEKILRFGLDAGKWTLICAAILIFAVLFLNISWNLGEKLRDYFKVIVQKDKLKRLSQEFSDSMQKLLKLLEYREYLHERVQVAALKAEISSDRLVQYAQAINEPLARLELVKIGILYFMRNHDKVCASSIDDVFCFYKQLPNTLTRTKTSDEKREYAFITILSCLRIGYKVGKKPHISFFAECVGVHGLISADTISLLDTLYGSAQWRKSVLSLCTHKHMVINANVMAIFLDDESMRDNAKEYLKNRPREFLYSTALMSVVCEQGLLVELGFMIPEVLKYCVVTHKHRLAMFMIEMGVPVNSEIYESLNVCHKSDLVMYLISKKILPTAHRMDLYFYFNVVDNGKHQTSTARLDGRYTHETFNEVNFDLIAGWKNLHQLVKAGAPVSDDSLRFLDLLGNKSKEFGQYFFLFADRLKPRGLYD